MSRELNLPEELSGTPRLVEGDLPRKVLAAVAANAVGPVDPAVINRGKGPYTGLGM